MCQKCTTSHFCLCCRLRSHLKQIAGRERGPRRTCRLSQRKCEKMLTHCTVMVRSPWDCRLMTARQYLSGAWSLDDHLAIAARGLYDYLKSQQLSYDFSCLNDHRIILRCPHNQGAAYVHCPNGDHAMLPTTCLQAYDF